jgi:broad specificity phosphatase PhoE
MTEMWLIRHGQTDWNLKNLIQGQQDIPLNATGMAQARNLALSLANIHFDAIYSSDLIRARQTAAILGEQLHLPVILDRRLREINQGNWEGLAFEEIKRRFDPNFSRSEVDLLAPRTEGAESIAEVAVRMVEAANDIHEKHNGHRILVSSHGLAVAALYLTANQKNLRDVFAYIPDNAQPLVIKVDSSITLPDFGNPGA